mgnify:FL=1
MTTRDFDGVECRPNVIQYTKPKSDKQIKRTKSTEKVEIKKTDQVQPKGTNSSHTTYVPDTNLTLACLVCLCFNMPIGAIAMYFSLSAARHYRDGDAKKGENFTKYSVYLSLFSIITTVLIVMAYVLWVVLESQDKRNFYKTDSSAS